MKLLRVLMALMESVSYALPVAESVKWISKGVIHHNIISGEY